MRVLTRGDLEKVLDIRTVIDAVERGLVEHARGTVSMPPRQIHSIDGVGTALVMSAYLGGMGVLAMKVISEFRGNRDRGIPSLQGGVLLLDADTGEVISLMDGATITAFRTGAAGALAARALSVVDAQVVGILGTGVQARTQIQGLWVVRDLQLVKAYSPTKAHVRAFCEEVADQLEVDALVADTPREVVAGSDIVITATNATEPVLPGSWLEEGMHATSIGAGPVQELDAEVYRRARVVVDWREGALEEARDLKAAIAEGAFHPEDIDAELGQLLAGMRPGRTAKEEITLFRSVGMALEDAATAAVAYERAVEAGLGTDVPL
ncbi:MAG: ornithine cyclodeaminase family protein [Candidatus Thermoplasmatota archaeon]|nr:ornithine cyclodeaminase family protein [Candidatus Thermoplasmatota archaeon]